MDLVYVLRDGDRNEELRYSLRSVAANLPHDNAWLIGHQPGWTANVEHVRTDQPASKYLNSTHNVVTACEERAISDPFVLMNDDFFVTRPTTFLPTLHRGLIADVLADYLTRYPKGGPYSNGMKQTMDLLETWGYDKPKSYELHVPLVVHKQPMLEAIARGQEAGVAVFHKRSAYGNIAGIGGRKTHDVKVYSDDAPIPRGPFASTDDTTFSKGLIGRQLRHLFAEPCEYERQ